MKLVSASSKNIESESRDLLVYMVYDAKDAKKLLEGQISKQAAHEGFKAKVGEIFFTHNFAGKGPKAYALVGLGEKAEVTEECFRKAAASAYKLAQCKHAAKVGLVLADGKHVKAAAEGVQLASYKFDRHISEKEERYVKEFAFCSGSKKAKDEIKEAQAIADAVSLARDLVNEGPSVMNPEAMAKEARKAAKAVGLDVKVLGEKELEKEKFGLLLAVARGSAEYAPPRVIRLAYRPKKKAKKHVVLVGKGVTFDTGGLDIKPPAGMLHMKTDMSGAAAVLGTMKAIAQLKPNVAVTGYMGCVENGVDARSYHPDDIIVSRKGLSVEIDNTDAEGRLVLADTMNYAQEKEKPDILIDLATLTGACVVALGPKIAGVFSNNDALAKKLQSHEDATGEAFWRMPLPDDLFEMMKTPLADMKNAGERYGGAITAALFLQKFVEKGVHWAHLDIAGPARNEKDQSYIPVGGSGFGVRTLVELLMDL